MFYTTMLTYINFKYQKLLFKNMGLPIPEMALVDSGPAYRNNMEIFQKTLHKIDKEEFDREVLMNLKNPLVESDFKNLSQKWIVAIRTGGSYGLIPDRYLMFINNSPSELAKVLDERDGKAIRFYYVEISNKSQKTEFVKANTYYDSVNSLLSWARCYLVDSVNHHLFMNWEADPWSINEK